MAGMKLSIKALAITGAILWGIYMFLAALLAKANIEIIWFSNKIFDLLVSIYPGLSATIGGAFIGLIWGAVCGAICGGILSWVYNRFV